MLPNLPGHQDDKGIQTLTHVFLDVTRWKLEAIDVGPIGFPSNVTIGHGPWPSLWVEARRGEVSTTPTLSRIG
jgi:hypothetical protein